MLKSGCQGSRMKISFEVSDSVRGNPRRSGRGGCQIKNKAYGSSFDDAVSFLKLLYPKGIKPSQYDDVLVLVRIFDKMKRIAAGQNVFRENSYQDIIGYSFLGLRRVERERSVHRPTDPVPKAANELPRPFCEPCKTPQTMGSRLVLKGFNGTLDEFQTKAESFQKTATSSLSGVAPMFQVTGDKKKNRKGKKKS